MNYSAQHQNYDLIPQQSPNMNNIGQQYQQNMTQYPGYNSYNQYNQFINYNAYNAYNGYQNYFPIVSLNHDANSNANQNSIVKIPEKRESKPLIVIDPTKNEAIDFSNFSKSKPNSLLNEIQPADNLQNIIPDVSINLNLSNVGDTYLEEFSPTLIEPFVLNKEELENNEACQEYSAKLPYTSSSMKQSHSIPQKMDSFMENKLSQQMSSSSETDLHQKSNLSFIGLEDSFISGRKVYNRDSLMAIGKSPRSLQPPFKLDSFECQEIISKEIIDIPKTLDNKMLNRRYNQRVINFGSPKSGSLSRLINGYLPPHFRNNGECSTNKHLENYRRNLKCILNKIVPQNFNLCITEIKAIIKDSEIVKIDECIDCLIEEIFDKAVKEEAYSVTYANLCVNIASFDQENDSKWNFKVSLLHNCKHMFETPLQEQLKAVKEHWEMKIEEEVDEKLKNIYRSDIDEQMKKARDKYFGNIRFIGELYMHDLLKPQIINSCVQTLMPKTNDEDAMLSLCKLIETCGKKFDEQHKDKMKDIIKTMIKISDNEKLERRIRYRVLDIIEMSDRKWSLRKVQAQKMIRPKTLEEIKNDDIEDKAIAASRFSSMKSQNRTLSNKVSSLNELKCKSTQSGNQSIELSSLSVVQDNDFELKPCYGLWNTSTKEKDLAEWQSVDNKKGGKKLFNNLKNNSKHKSKSGKQMDESPRKLQTQGKFAPLMNEEDNNDNSLPSSSPVRDPSPYENKSEDENLSMDRDVLFDHLLQTKTLNVHAWCSQKDISGLIYEWLDRIMEKDKATRNLVGDQLADLIACDKLSKDDLIEGLAQFLELVDDLITDIPKIWLFLAEFLERFIQNQQSYVDFYTTIFEKRLPDTNVTECIINILKYAADRLGNDLIKELFDKQLRSLMDLVISQEDMTTQLQSHNLTFLLTSDIVLSDNKYSDPFKSELISSFSCDLESIYHLLESRFTLSEMQEDIYVEFIANCLFSFICDLTTQALVINFIVDKETFFRRLIDSKPAFEALILSVLCTFANRLNEKDLLLTVIENLSGNKLISKDAFCTFIQNTEDSSVHMEDIDDQNSELMVKAIRSTFDSDRR